MYTLDWESILIESRIEILNKLLELAWILRWYIIIPVTSFIISIIIYRTVYNFERATGSSHRESKRKANSCRDLFDLFTTVFDLVPKKK